MAESKPRLTIGIPVYNGKEDLWECLRSIEKHIQDVPYEVIVVDDASSDGTYEMVTETFPHVNIQRNTFNQGIARSTDYILENMQGTYLLRLDADTRITDTSTVPALLTHMDNHPDVGVLAPKLVNTDGSFQPSYESHFKHPLEWFWDYALWIKKVIGKIRPPDELQSHKPFPVAYMASAAILVRKTAISEVGGQDPKMDFFMEDADWVWRMNKAGWGIYFWPKYSIIHIGGQSGTLYIHTRDRSIKNLYYFYHKHRPGLANLSLLFLAIIAGSSSSLILAVGIFPVSFFNSKVRKINKRALKSFSNVFIWHMKYLFK